MKILIADDERMVRLTLKSMLLDLKISSDDIYEVKNGEEFLMSISELSPDIAFVDIKMPKLNGLDAISMSKTLCPNTRWVILTGFSEFDYAKQAIALGVSEYLLKPIDPETLEKTINKLFEEITKNILDSNKKFKKDIIALYYDYNSIEKESLEPVIVTGSFIILSFFIDTDYTKNSNIDIKKAFSKALKLQINEFLVNDIRIALFNKSNSQIIVICGYNANNDFKNKNAIYSYLNKAKKLKSNYVSSSFSITTIQSEEFSSYKEYHKYLNIIDNLSILRCTLGINTNYNQKHLKTFRKDDIYFNLSSSIIDLCDRYNNKQFLKFVNTLKDIENRFYNCKLLEKQKTLDYILEFLHCRINLKSNNVESLDALLDDLHRHGNLLIKTKSTNKSDYIEEIKDFIDENYMDDIGINTIAETLSLTPNYLSTLFRKKTGVKFIDYINQIRILKAKKLLAETNMTVNKIAESVGYYSSSYFTKLFLRYTECCPSEYRKQFR